MELPDESPSYNYQGLLMPAAEEWTAAAELRARYFLHPARFKELQPRLLQCRGQVAAEREMRAAPPELQPLEPGFINLPQELLDGYRRKRDRVINNLVVKTPHAVPIGVQMADHNEDDLNRYNRKALPDFLQAALKGTNEAHYEVSRPTADLVMPVLSEHTMGQLLQMLMLATVIEVRLMGINPYGQPGVEVHRRHLLDSLKKMEATPSSQGASHRPRAE
jgi:hypothetical protein